MRSISGHPLYALSRDCGEHWSEPEIILEAAGNEHLFNNAITSDGAGGYIMLYESDDPAYVPFSFKFARSRDLSHWEKIPDAVYGKDKYVGGPALYREGEWYYLLYLNHEEGFWSTRIARSRNLLEWEEAAPERVFLSPDFGHLTDPVHHPGVYECNASDAELIEWRGRVLVWFNGGDQRTCGDFKLSEFAGSRRELLEYFFI